MGTFFSRYRVYSMSINKNMEIKKMTKKQIIKTIEDKHQRMDWFITYHQNSADKSLSKADAKLKIWIANVDKDYVGDCYRDYRDSEEMATYDSHCEIVRCYKEQKEMLGELLEEIN